MATLQKLTRISMLAKRNPNITEEEFHKQWSKIKGSLATPFLKRLGFTKYLQVLAPPSPPLSSISHVTDNALRILVPSTILRLGGPQFDGFADLLAPNFEAFLEAFEKLFCNERFRSNEEDLIDPTATVIINARWEEVYLFGGGGAKC